MKKLVTILFTVYASLFTLHSLSQSCLPEGISFTTQAQIDSFQINYPNCTEIGGDLIIGGDDITNLNGLNVITRIEGRLVVGVLPGSGGSIGAPNPMLISLIGLDNLNSVSDGISIHINESIQDLSGLEQLDTCGGLWVSNNQSLQDLTGLTDLKYANNIMIGGNESLTSLTGMNSLDSLSGFLGIVYNNSLANLTGLENIVYTGGADISSNSMLTSLTGLDNLATVNGDLVIHENNLLINFTGLQNLTSVAGNFDVGYYEGNGNNSLQNFIGLGNLDSIGGGFFISYNDSLFNFSGLNSLIYISDRLKIFGNPHLNDLTGLENLHFAYEVEIENNASLNTLEGLEGLTSIGSNISVSNNLNLDNLIGITNLSSIGGVLDIENNEVLTSLIGLENIEAESISDLLIIDNASLFECEVQSICDYLTAPNGEVIIENNAPGCNNREEVEEACETLFVEQKKQFSYCTIYPNPFSCETTFKIILDEPSQVNLVVIDRFGRVMGIVLDEYLPQGTHKITWRPERMSSNIYFYRLTAGNQSAAGKMVVVK